MAPRQPLNRPEISRTPARASRAAALAGASQAAGAPFRARATPVPGIYGLTALRIRRAKFPPDASFRDMAP
jgi:hypothetical protein